MYMHLSHTKTEYVLSKQLLRSGTSIGANTEEAIGAQSTKDFLAKISIAYKEARETLYWLRLLNDSQIIAQEQYKDLSKDLDQILKILGKIQITLKRKLDRVNS